MQTHRQSRLEVSIDFGLSLLVNLGVQILFYGRLATLSRSSAFAVLVLGLALPRRYVTRRGFNRLVPPGGQQSRWHSWLEVGVDTVIGIVVAFLLQWLFYGPAATWGKAGGLTICLYAITMVRRYILRRISEAWSRRQEQPWRTSRLLRHPPAPEHATWPKPNIDTEPLGEGRQGTGGGIAEGTQGRQQCGQEDVDPLMRFALAHAEQASLDHLEAVRLQGRE